MRPSLFSCWYAILPICLLGCNSLAIAQSQDNLPNDKDKRQLVVVAPEGSEIPTWFNTSTKLRLVKQATAFTVLTPGSKLFETRFSDMLGTKFPIVAYMRADGGLIYFADRETIPSTPEKLYAEMADAAAMARNAEPAHYPGSFNIEAYQSAYPSTGNEDCPDGFCPVPNRDERRFPGIRPFANPNRDPFDSPITGWFSDSVSSGIWLVFSILALSVVLLFAVLIFGAMIVVVRWIK